MRVAAPAAGALPTAFARVALASAGLAAIVTASRMRVDFRGRFAAAFALGVLNSAVPFLMFAYAARALPSGYSAILNALAPLMGVVVGALFFGERANLRKVAGVLAGIAGVAVLTGAGPVPLDLAVVLGIAACVIATVCYGFAGFLTRRWISDRGGLDSRLVAFGAQVGATVALAPVLAVQQAMQPLDWTSLSPAVWASLLALGLLCTSVAYVLYFRLIADIGPMRSLTVTFLIPVFAMAWGALFLDEAVTVAHLAGGGLIALALWWVLVPGTPATTTAR